MGRVRSVKKASRERVEIDELIPIRLKVGGIDIGRRQMHVCGPAREDGTGDVRTFATTTSEINDSAKWLSGLKVESVAMESTGVYWIPVLEILESRGFAVLLADTRPLSRVPGRKTDVTDCRWIQTLHSHGLLQGSYRPTEEISQLRSLTRQKAVLVADQSDWLRRMLKCLDQMNVRIHHAVSDTQGVTGMAIVRAIVQGERDPQKLARLRAAACQKSQEQIASFLTGHWRSDHLFNLEQCLKMYDALTERIAAYEVEIQERMKGITPAGREDLVPAPLVNPQKRKAMKRRNQEGKWRALYRMVGADLATIDGIGVETAEVIVSEYGVDVSKFANEKQFVAHLKLAPRQAISGGKLIRKPGRKITASRAGRALRQAATTVGKSSTALGAYYRRISRTKGAKVAVFATARKLAILIYRLLRWGQSYVDIGQRAYEDRFQALGLRSLTTNAARLGYQLVQANATASD